MGQLSASTVSLGLRSHDKRSRHNVSDRYWWSSKIGSHLMLLLTKAGYTLDAQAEALSFLYHTVAPRLGPKPTSPIPKWQSFMTDDFTPFEYSWKWGRGDNPPEIRYSIEAISPITNNPSDPLNQAATYALLSQLQSMTPELDLSLFHHFVTCFFGPQSPVLTSTKATHQQSSLFLAFELSRKTSQDSTKCYFVPVSTPSNSAAEQISSAIRSSSYHSHLPAIDELEQFFRQDQDGRTIKPIMLGIDCVDASESRLKIYARSTRTSFEFVRRVMSLGGRRRGMEKEEGQLKELWCRVLGLPKDMNTEEELPFRDHPTAGTLFYFDVGPKETVPDVKVYIPVRHYSKSDQQIVSGLTSFMEKNGSRRFVDCYKEAIEGLATEEGIDVGTGVHTYVTAAYKKGGLAVTSYFNPQMYHRARWA
ncbi:uncharacterized protein PODANS_5_2350 [Podospora anserina S mat+]|uniref:Podospora anserina S mat+ genomic DNA chromosome 5, supercontig 1 n=1 Tax=Podospora anserina (strain S / ATCC MYA-4624 / DSM 980 / FGSC 10383) TaxID=515849 RepID=B2AEJ8_PODAN|nr:uncharacterized protein PODANS_5_2350 [Podospora anserina S mat+]CAP61864.1 unnamed protein product [Podospora anserina S mat+]CDP28939.1 Putative tryptophan dimethylallyltransferase [Podospora anserina S mat+]